MRSIKLKIIAWIIGFMTIIGTCIAQDTLTPVTPFDTMLFGITVETDPVIVLVETEDLENNEPLQQMLVEQSEQTKALNKYLLNLNEVIENLPKNQLEVEQQRLDKYNINPVYINDMARAIHIIFYWTLVLWLISWLLFVNVQDKLYWTKKSIKEKNLLWLIIVSFIIGYMIPKLSCLTLIDNYILWSNLDKLF